MTQLKTEGYRYVGVVKDSGLNLEKITDERGGRVIAITVWEAGRGQQVELTDRTISELIADLQELTA